MYQGRHSLFILSGHNCPVFDLGYANHCSLDAYNNNTKYYYYYYYYYQHLNFVIINFGGSSVKIMFVGSEFVFILHNFPFDFYWIVCNILLN
jgi:hypothetical protein